LSDFNVTASLRKAMEPSAELSRWLRSHGFVKAVDCLILLRATRNILIGLSTGHEAQFVHIENAVDALLPPERAPDIAKSLRDA
jgi:hypothetical protein